jgi:hypothetical protein
MSMSPEWRRARAQKAARERWHGADADVADADADAELERARVDRLIDELVEGAPLPTPEQADRLRRLFKYGPAEGGASG